MRRRRGAEEGGVGEGTRGGLGEGLGKGPAEGPLPGLDQSLRLLHPSPGHEPTGGLGEGEPQVGGVEGGKRPGQKGRPPAQGGHQEVAHEGGQEPPHRPKGLEEDHHPAPLGLWAKLPHEACRHGELRPQAQAGEKAEEEDPGEAWGQGGEEASHPCEEEAVPHHRLPAQAVRKPPSKGRSQEHPQKPRASPKPRLLRAQAELPGEGGQGEADEAHVHGVQGPAQAEEEEEPKVGPPQGQAVQAGNGVHGSRLREAPCAPFP